MSIVQDILILRGTKHQLSVYGKIPMIFSLMPVLHFSSVSAQFQKEGLKNK
jgi:hypothetical protein